MDEGRPETCWCRFKPIFFKRYRPRTGLAKIFEDAFPNFGSFSEKLFRVWKHEFTSTILPNILVTSSAPYSGPALDEGSARREDSPNAGQYKCETCPYAPGRTRNSAMAESPVEGNGTCLIPRSRVDWHCKSRDNTFVLRVSFTLCCLHKYFCSFLKNLMQL